MILRVTDHAVERYAQRFKPQLRSSEQARQELLALCELGEPIEKPDWFYGAQQADLYLELTPGVVAAVVKGAVVTVVAKPEIRPVERAKRKDRKRRQRAQRNWQNRLVEQGRHRRGGPSEWA